MPLEAESEGAVAQIHSSETEAESAGAVNSIKSESETPGEAAQIESAEAEAESAGADLSEMELSAPATEPSTPVQV